MSDLKENIESKEKDTIDIKLLIKKFSSYWYYFILSLTICIFLAWGYNQYTPKKYHIWTKIEIKDDKNTDEVMDIADILSFSNNANLENQKEILKSYSLAEKTIKKLNLGISYFKHGWIQTKNLYKSKPFEIILDSNYSQIAGVDYFIKIKNEDDFELNYKCKNKNGYNVRTNQKIKNNLKINYKGNHSFNEWINKTSKEDTILRFKIIKTDDFHETVKYKKKYSFTIHSLEKLSYQYVKKIKVKPTSNESTVLEISIKGSTPYKYKDYLETLTEIYKEDELREKNQFTMYTIKYLSKDSIKTINEISILEDQLRDLKTNNPGLETAAKEFGTLHEEQLIEREYLNKEEILIYYNSILNYVLNSESTIDKYNPSISPTSIGVTNQELNGLINKLMIANTTRQELERKIKPEHPEFKAIEIEINSIKNNIIENVKESIKSLESAKKQDEIQLSKIRQDIQKLPQVIQSYRRLEAGIEIFKEHQKKITALLLEARTIVNSTKEDHRQIDKARFSDKPISPNTTLIYIIGIILGISIPMIIIILRDFFNESIRSKEDINKITDIPVLGLVGHSEKANNLVVIDSPKSILSESFRSLRTNIQYLSSDKKQRIITITSSVGGEGKTFFASNLATILASAGYKTVIIGADLRKPKLSEYFKYIDNSIGLSTHLINKSTLKDIIITSEESKNLSIISSGPIPPNPAELLNSDRMKEFLTNLKKKFEYIILDTPPIGIVTDGVITMKFSDINLYVVRHNYTKKKMLEPINEIKKMEKAKNINIIINDYKMSKADSYGYGYGYGGDGYYEE